MNRDKMYHFTIGFMIAMLIAMIVVAYSPTPKPDFVCEGCGSMHWHSVSAESEDE